MDNTERLNRHDRRALLTLLKRKKPNKRQEFELSNLLKIVSPPKKPVVPDVKAL